MNKPAYSPDPEWRNLIPFKSSVPKTSDLQFRPEVPEPEIQEFRLDYQLNPLIRAMYHHE
jgi:hypothetical protein